MPFSALQGGIKRELQMALAQTHEVDGLCCSFAMDWLRKRLVEKEVGGRYLNAGILAKIAKRQKQQKESEFGPAAVAAAYRLKMNVTPACRGWEKQFAGEWGIVNPGITGGAYYVSCPSTRITGEGHGFAIDAREKSGIFLADVGSGILLFTEMSVVDVCKKHFSILKDKEHLPLSEFQLYFVTRGDAPTA